TVTAQDRTSSVRGWGNFAYDSRGRDGRFLQVCANVYNTAVLRDDGRIFVNGDNLYAQAEVPSLPPGRRYVDMDANASGGVAVVDDGNVVVWGSMWDPGSPQLNYRIPSYDPAPPLPPGVTYQNVGGG